MRHRRVLSLALLAALALSVAVIAVPASAAHRAANPAPPLPHLEPLITEGVTVEGPLINGVNLPQLR